MTSSKVPGGPIRESISPPVTRATFNIDLAQGGESADLSEGTGFHALRHYDVALLIARGGASVKLVQARLGHTPILSPSPSLPAAVARAVSGIRVSAAADKGHDRHLTRPPDSSLA